MIANNTTLSDFKKISGMNGRIYNFCSQAGIKTFDDFMSFVPSTYCGNMTYRTIAEINHVNNTEMNNNNAVKITFPTPL